MFELPVFTTFVMIAVPGFWLLYTLVFLFVSRHWHLADEE